MMLNTRLARLERQHGAADGGEMHVPLELVRHLHDADLNVFAAIARKAIAAGDLEPEDRSRWVALVRKVREGEPGVRQS
jgi:hypothetical protein